VDRLKTAREKRIYMVAMLECGNEKFTQMNADRFKYKEITDVQKRQLILKWLMYYNKKHQ